MFEEPWKRNEPDSPCVRICVLHPDAQICIGCYRTEDEISTWAAMAAAERTRIRATLPARASRLKVRRGGRAAKLRGRD